MVATTRPRIEDVAHDLFEIVTHLCIATPRGRRRTSDLKEVEFLTLAILHDRGTAIVGDIQRMLGILPAQMSRVIRSLENRPEPLIACRINPRDKRKIDVCLTESGAGHCWNTRQSACTGLSNCSRTCPKRTSKTSSNCSKNSAAGSKQACLPSVIR